MNRTYTVFYNAALVVDLYMLAIWIRWERVNTSWPLMSHSGVVWRYLTTIAFVGLFSARVCHNCILCGFPFHWHGIFHLVLLFPLSFSLSLTFSIWEFLSRSTSQKKSSSEGTAWGMVSSWHLQCVIRATHGDAGMRLLGCFQHHSVKRQSACDSVFATLYKKKRLCVI